MALPPTRVSDDSLESVTAAVVDVLARPEDAARVVQNAERILDYLGHGTMRVGEAAAVLGVTENSVKNWVRAGTFPSAFQTPGGHWRFVASEVFALRDASRRARELNSAGAGVQPLVVATDPFADAPVF